MPKDEDITLEDKASGADGFLRRIPEEIRNTLSDEQISAINQAFRPTKHSIDIRLSIPLPWGHRYFVLLSGKERRSPERQRFERLFHPLLTKANLLAILIMSGISLYLFISILRIFFESMN